MNQLGKERRSSLARHTERNTQSTRPTQKVHTNTKIIKDEPSKIQNPYIHPQWDIKRNEQKHKHSYSQKHIETQTHTHRHREPDAYTLMDSHKLIGTDIEPNISPQLLLRCDLSLVYVRKITNSDRLLPKWCLFLCLSLSDSIREHAYMTSTQNPQKRPKIM